MFAKTFTYANTLLVPYSAQQVYDVVDDVGQYHRFLPNCAASGVVSRSVESGSQHGTERVLGFMDLAFLGLRYRLDSDNLHTPHSRIVLHTASGPFQSLDGQWDIAPLGDGTALQGCKVTYTMRWQYNSPLFAMTIGQRFESIAKQLLDAFIAETARRAA